MGDICGNGILVTPISICLHFHFLLLNQKLVSLSASQYSGYVGKLKVHKSGKVK